MKTIIYLFCICTILIACNNKNDSVFASMPPELDSLLDEYIANYPNNKIYYMIFETRCGKQFFTLQCSSDCYDSNYMDGCFMKKGKIIVFWSINKSWKDSLLHIPQEELCFDSLTRYTDLSKVDVDYDAPYNPQTYRILSLSQYRKSNTSDWSFPNPACDSNVIQSSVLNKIVNDYININDSPNIVYLRFNHVNGEYFVSVGQDYVYDSDSFSGMFYRNGRIVVLYSIDKIENLEIIDKQSLLPIHAINDYKSLKRKFPRFPEKEYKIIWDPGVGSFDFLENKIW